MDKVHRPDIVRAGSRGPVVAQLSLDPALGCPVPQLQTQLIVNPMCSLDVDIPALALQRDVHTPVAVPNARLADRLDAGLNAGLIALA